MKIIYKAQGERRFFRICMKWLAKYDTEAARRNIQYVAEYGRIDDLYCFVDTPLEKEMFKLLKEYVAEAIVAYKEIKND